MPRILVLISAIVLFESLFFTALGPLLPTLRDEWLLTTSQAGLLSAAYGLGTLAAALPAAVAATSLGVKSTVAGGLLVLACMSLVFGAADQYMTMLLAQLVAGAAAAAIWSGAMAWLIATTPVSRRGEAIGISLGATAAGQILGPVVGGVAAEAGRLPTFSVTAAAGFVLTCAAVACPRPALGDRSLLFATAMQSVRVRRAMWLNAVPGVVIGTLLVLGTLHLHDLGAHPGQVAAILAVAAVAGIVVQPLVGRWSDRRGRLEPIRLGLVATIPVALGLPLLQSRWLAAASVVAVLVTIRAFWGPGLALLADAADDAHVSHTVAASLALIAGTTGLVFGSAGSGAIAQITTPTFAFSVIAAILLLARLTIAAPRA